MKTLIERFIEEIAYTMDILNNYNPNPKIDPIILFTGSLILTMLTSFSSNLIPPFIAIAYSLTLIIVLKINARYILRIEALIVILGLIPSTPLLFSRTGYVHSLDDLGYMVSYVGVLSFIKLLLRVTASPLPIVTALVYIGWPMLSNALSKYGFLREPVKLISITITIIPQVVRYVLKLLIAREARMLRYSIDTTWKTLSAIVGDVIANSNVYAEKLQLAITARTVSGKDSVVKKGILLNKATILYTMFLVVLIAMGLVIQYDVLN